MAGVTWFARQEARVSGRGHFQAAMLLETHAAQAQDDAGTYDMAWREHLYAMDGLRDVEDGMVVQRPVVGYSCIVFGAADPKTGACGSVFQLAANERLNHRIEVVGGVMAEESAALLKRFFAARRAGSPARDEV